MSTVGRIQPHMEAKVINSEGRTLGRGEAGELCSRGYAVMLGYWDDPEQTAKAIDADGWMHTGDLGVIDDEGYCNIVGREKDMIIRGGENVYPREIEEFLFRHPKIEDVAVVGIPDDKFGEQVCAWIRTRRGETTDGRGRSSVLPRPDRALQSAGVRVLRGCVPDDRHRQDSEISHPQDHDRAPGS